MLDLTIEQWTLMVSIVGASCGIIALVASAWSSISDKREYRRIRKASVVEHDESKNP